MSFFFSGFLYSNGKTMTEDERSLRLERLKAELLGVCPTCLGHPYFEVQLADGGVTTGVCGHCWGSGKYTEEDDEALPE
jgi:hypothetical protein